MSSIPQARSSETVTVQLLGQKMALRSDGNPRHLERLASFVRRKGDEIAAAAPVSSTKLAALVALNIAEDYFQVLEESRQLRSEVAQRSRQLLRQLQEIES